MDYKPIKFFHTFLISTLDPVLIQKACNTKGEIHFLIYFNLGFCLLQPNEKLALGLDFWFLIFMLLYGACWICPQSRATLNFEKESEEIKNYRRLEIKGAVEMIYTMSLILQMKKLLLRELMCWNSGENSGFYASFPKSISNHMGSWRKTRVRCSVGPYLYVKTSFLIGLA